MAGFGDPASTLAQQHTPAIDERRLSKRSLPNGSCNYRDAAVGKCGCDQFWDKCSAELHDESVEHRPSSERSTWCVCGHHACFHLRESGAPERPAQAAPTLRQSQQSNSNARAHGHVGRGRDTPSQASTTGLPGIPSVCMLSHEGPPATDNEARHATKTSRQTIAGLGLSMMQLESVGTRNRLQSPPSPTVVDDVGGGSALHESRKLGSEPEIPSTRANSIQLDMHPGAGPSYGILDKVFEFNRTLQLDVPGDTIPNTYNPDEFIQSATEVATPSIRNTPDLGAADQAVQDGKKFIDALSQLATKSQRPSGSPSRPMSATSTPGPQFLLTHSPTPQQEQLQNLLKSASPQGVQTLVSYLAPLHNLLNSMPNVANTMRDLGSRLDLLENGSFNYVQPHELNQTLEMYEGRLIDVEHRMDEHERYHQAMDDQHSTSSFTRRRIGNVAASFASNASVQSTTSSTLILTARNETEMEIGNIKDRLDTLEAAAAPTTTNPWEVEVVLLPWGRDLRGIWFSPEESMHDLSRTMTQDSEEWTQARSSRLEQNHQSSQGPSRDTDLSSHRNRSLLSGSESGWSSQAISDWASGSGEDWLFPKACGSNNLVYQRLQSRGFIRNVMMKGSSSRDIQVCLSNAFKDVLEHLSYTDHDQDPTVLAYPGLRASFIPLRKVFKDSKLRYLTPAEMSSSALWSAQFLSAGVMMRASGGKKRLYVTHREAYMQPNNSRGTSWSWQELRQLPRYQFEQDSQMEGNDEQCQPLVPEADAKEACWQFVESCDAPPASIHSSFGSHQSLQLSMRPADRQWRRSITPSSILKNKQFQPISPLSEFHPQRPSHLRNRTASTSIIETFPPGSSKRRHNSSPVKQSSAPQTASRAPSVSLARPKRRRVANSTSTRSEEIVRTEAEVPIWNATPRRSREPPSPFYSSGVALQRTSSDMTSRPSQRSVAVVGKSTPFAYATPHSGPFVGGPGFAGYSHGGDTEPDNDDDDDGEQSWRGVTDNDDDKASNSSPEGDAGAGEPGSFSGDDSGFGSESGDEDEDLSDEDAFGAQRPYDDDDEDEDEDEEDVLDSLLDVLQH